jgi:uncharacterized membrane protein
MGILVAGLIVFFAVHSVAIVNEPWRDRVAARIGEGPWRGVYSLISLLGLVLIVWGYGLARLQPVALYAPPTWLRHITLLLMVPVFPLLLAAYLPGRIKATAKHPMLAAVKLWAFAHLLANGMVADVLLFGSFLVWGVVDRISLKHRAERPVPGLPPTRLNDAIAILAGLGLYVAFLFWLHRWLFGVSPIGGGM